MKEWAKFVLISAADILYFIWTRDFSLSKVFTGTEKSFISWIFKVDSESPKIYGKDPSFLQEAYLSKINAEGKTKNENCVRKNAN